MKRLSLLTLTLMLSAACQGADHDNPVSARTVPNAAPNQKTNVSHSLRTSCDDADAWTCAVEAAIVQKTNEKRASQGKAPLTQIFEASTVARGHSQEMIVDKFGHDGFDKRVALLRQEVPGKFQAAGENVAGVSYGDWEADALAEEFVTMWWNSEGHRKNMLNGDFEYIGVGVVKLKTVNAKGEPVSGVDVTQIFFN